MVQHVRFESLYISLPSSESQQSEMTKFYVFCRTRTAMANFSYLLFELHAVGVCLARAYRPTEQIYTAATLEDKISIHFLQGVVPAVAVVIAKTPQ